MAVDEKDRTGHRVPDTVRALCDAVDDLAGLSLLGMDAPATREALIDIVDLESRLAAVKLALLAHADQVSVAAESGATSTGTWWAVATRQTRRSAAGLVRTAQALDTRWHAVRDGLAAGAMNLDQARVVVRALDDLPTDLPTDLGTNLLARAETTMVEATKDFDPDELRVLGDRLLSVIAPEVGEEADRRKLEQAEARARQKRRLTLSFDGHGAAHGRFQLPEAQGKALQLLLHAFAAPGHVNTTGGAGTWVKGRPTPEKLGEAFGELIETFPKDQAPKHGRTTATVVVTINLTDLISGLGSATLSTGGRISVGEARRLACEAGIIPVVLGGPSKPLDLGDTSRFFNHHQRVALGLRDGGCTAQGCDWPPGMCHAHHDKPWSEGGRTDLDDGRLLCPHHHQRIHDPAYDHVISADNQVTFHRRT